MSEARASRLGRNETWRNSFMVSCNWNVRGAELTALCQDLAAFATTHGTRKLLSHRFETARELRLEVFAYHFHPHRHRQHLPGTMMRACRNRRRLLQPPSWTRTGRRLRVRCAGCLELLGKLR